MERWDVRSPPQVVGTGVECGAAAGRAGRLGSLGPGIEGEARLREEPGAAVRPEAEGGGGGGGTGRQRRERGERRSVSPGGGGFSTDAVLSPRFPG